VVNRKAEQEWYREKKNNNVAHYEIKIVHAPNLSTALLESTSMPPPPPDNARHVALERRTLPDDHRSDLHLGVIGPAREHSPFTGRDT
jgi:hypothetical protein